MSVTVEDMEAARNLIARQKFCTDDRDLAGLAECWARDARSEMCVNGREPIVVEGRENILDFAQRGWKGDTQGHVHLLSTLEIKVGDGGELHADSYCAYLSPKGDFVIEGYGRYKDRLVKEDGAWRLLSRQVTVRSGFQVEGRERPKP